MFNTEELKVILGDEPKFRFGQIIKAVYGDLIDNWTQATSLPVLLRQKLELAMPLAIKAEIIKAGSTEKALMVMEDGAIIETVLIENKDGRYTVCLSCQVGCPLGCAFCATGKLGYKRNLEASEITAQLLFWYRKLKKSEHKINNVVFMGMGEPFLNYEQVLAAIKIINDKDAFNLGARHISISTAGVIPGILALAKEPKQINLAISLHAADDATRMRLMPIAQKYKLKDLLEAVDKYIKATDRQVMFEYLLIKGVNDTKADAEKLAKLLRNPLYMVNLLYYNPTGVFQATDKKGVSYFKKVLTEAGLKATIRQSAGADIAAACGQLAGKVVK